MAGHKEEIWKKSIEIEESPKKNATKKKERKTGEFEIFFGLQEREKKRRNIERIEAQVGLDWSTSSIISEEKEEKRTEKKRKEKKKRKEERRRKEGRRRKGIEERAH